MNLKLGAVGPAQESLQESLQKFDEQMATLTHRFGELEDEVLRHEKDEKQETPADDGKEDVHKQQNALKSNASLAATICNP